MPEIAVIGSLNLDTTVRVPRLPRPGETVLGSGHFEDTGGKGANQAVAAARLGREVAMIGMVGADDAGTALRRSLEVDGVDVSGVTTHPDLPTGLAVITVDEAGENSIVVDPAANGAFDPETLESLKDPIGSASVVLLQLEIPIEMVAAGVRLAQGTVVVDPAPAAPLPSEILSRADVIVPNATELATLTGGEVPTSPEEAIRAAGALVGPGAVVVTLGGLGAVAVDGSGSFHVAPPRIDPVDPTAAGDAFCGGLADALVRGLGLAEAVEWAVACGALAATRWGAQASLPTREEVLALKEPE